MGFSVKSIITAGNTHTTGDFTKVSIFIIQTKFSALQFLKKSINTEYKHYKMSARRNSAIFQKESDGGVSGIKTSIGKCHRKPLKQETAGAE